ncbi:MAG: AzlD domain-containing protein [Spirochaetaceae bacterium]|jgi:branched-subunit amino acid transport protein AzlD|nr:AzlD domain-containing protein [Spirochaetaceae bacterium]
MLSLSEAFLYTFVMAAAVFACRAFSFIVFKNLDAVNLQKESFTQKFIGFVEKTAPPAAMTVLAFNAIAGEIAAAPSQAPPVLVSAALTAALHIWKRNALLSIGGGTALYVLWGWQ